MTPEELEAYYRASRAARRAWEALQPQQQIEGVLDDPGDYLPPRPGIVEHAASPVDASVLELLRPV